MPLLTEKEVRAAATTRTHVAKSASAILKEETHTTLEHFDIFLSHSIRDADIVLGVYRILQNHGKIVYVDWIQDTELDRTKVTPNTAARLRKRLKQCDALFYLHSKHSASSRWMPWELGFFDAHKANVAILPVKDSPETTFKGEEYLGLYPFVDFANPKGQSSTAIFINRDPENYETFDRWKASSDKLRP